MNTKSANRPVQPTVEDLYAPAHSARKLWKRIGKPHGQFRTWANQVIQPLLPSSEIATLSLPSKRGSPTEDYYLSTHIAEIILAQVDTDEGRELLETMWAASRAFVTMGVEGVNELVMAHTPAGAAARERLFSAEAQAMEMLNDIDEDRELLACMWAAASALVMDETPEGAAAREQLASAEVQALDLLNDIDEEQLQESPELIPVQTLIDVITDHTLMAAAALGCDPKLMPMGMAIDILASLLGDDEAGRRELVEYLVYYPEVRALRGKMSQPR